MKTSNTPLPDLPNVEDYGWKSVEDNSQLITTTDPLGPTDSIKLALCDWKTKYNTNHWRRDKHNIICTDFCSCLQCEDSEDNQETKQQNLFSEEYIDDTIVDNVID